MRLSNKLLGQGYVKERLRWGEVKWWFYVTINDISVIYVTAHRFAGGLKKKFDLRSGSQCHRHFVGFFNMPVLAPSLRKFYGRYGDLIKQYEVTLSRMLHDILDDDYLQGHPPLTTILTLLLIWTLLPNLTFYLIARGFHRTFATGAACQQRTLTPPDNWSSPIWDLQTFSFWDQWQSIWHTSLCHLSLIWLFTDIDVITDYRFP